MRVLSRYEFRTDLFSNVKRAEFTSLARTTNELNRSRPYKYVNIFALWQRDRKKKDDTKRVRYEHA